MLLALLFLGNFSMGTKWVIKLRGLNERSFFYPKRRSTTHNAPT
jgi:hypothetical protein